MNTLENTTEINALQAELRGLLSSLSESSSAYGDWKHIKYAEAIARGKAAPYTELEMNDYYEERDAIRARINEIQSELEGMETLNAIEQ